MRRKLRGERLFDAIEAGELRYAACCDSPSVPQPPAVPDPANQTIAQARALPSQYTPYGTAVYSGDPSEAGSFRQTITLSPEQQQLYEGRTRIARSLLGRSDTALSTLPVGYQFRGAEDPTTNRFYTAQRALLDPAWDREQERLDQRLTNQGIPMGSDAYDYEQDQFRRSRGAAYEQAAAGALDRGFSQDIAERQQNLNEIAQALGGSQLQPLSGGAGNPLDVQSAYAAQQAGQNRAYQGQLAGYNADIAAQNQTMSTIGTLGTAAAYFF